MLEVFKAQSADDLQRRREASKLEIKNHENTITTWEAAAVDYSKRLAEHDQIQAEITPMTAQLESLSPSRGSVEINRNVDQDIISIRQHASIAQPEKPMPVKVLTVSIVLVLLLRPLSSWRSSTKSMTGSRLSPEFPQVHFPDARSSSTIPSTPRKSAHGEVLPLTADDDRHALPEAFRSLRSSLIFLPVEGPPPKVFLVTSAVPNEGKSTVTVNLAITLSMSGARVLLVDGEPAPRRDPSHARRFELRIGLSDVLRNGADVEAAVKATAYPSLWLLPRGGSVSTPGELYLSKETDRFLQRVHASYDYVILDSSPVMVADDTPCVTTVWLRKRMPLFSSFASPPPIPA